MLAARRGDVADCYRLHRTPPPEPELLKTATIKDIMDAMVDPSAEFLFDSVAMIADEHGITEKAPQTEEEWAEVRRRAIQLLEAPNLLVMKGRKVAQAGEQSKNPDIELQPAQIQALIDADRLTFIDRAHTLQDAATMALKASDAKDKKALFAACERLTRPARIATRTTGIERQEAQEAALRAG